MNFSVMITGMVSGFMSDLLGYKIFFIAVLFTTIPIFVMSRLIPFTYDDERK